MGASEPACALWEHAAQSPNIAACGQHRRLDADDLLVFLEMGMDPDSDFVGRGMYEVIDAG